MEPSISEYSIVVVDKLHYGWNLPDFFFPFGRVGYKKICFTSLCRIHQLKVYDIVVFDFPDPVIRKRFWLKRIIATERKNFEFKNHQLQIDGNIVPFYKKVEFLPDYHSTPIFELPEELLKYPNNLRYYFLNGIGKKGVVPSKSFLLMGDNTRLSRDSRVYGFIPYERIIGKVIYVFSL